MANRAWGAGGQRKRSGKDAAGDTLSPGGKKRHMAAAISCAPSSCHLPLAGCDEGIACWLMAWCCCCSLILVPACPCMSMPNHFAGFRAEPYATHPPRPTHPHPSPATRTHPPRPTPPTPMHIPATLRRRPISRGTAELCLRKCASDRRVQHRARCLRTCASPGREAQGDRLPFVPNLGGDMSPYQCNVQFSGCSH